MGKSGHFLIGPPFFYFLFLKLESFSFSFFLLLGKQVVFHNIKELETGEMAEQLGATIALSEDLTLVSSTYLGWLAYTYSCHL